MRNCLAFTAIFFALAISGSAQNYYINTFAGNGTLGYSGDGGAATAAEFQGPSGVCSDASGNIYVADPQNNVIRKVNTSGIISTFAGNGTLGYSGDGGAATAAEFQGPTAVCSDASGNIYIADEYNYVVRKVNTGGIISNFAGNASGFFSGDGGPATAAGLTDPCAVCSDPSGNIYIADWYGEKIRKVNTGGIISTIAGDSIAGYSGDGGPATNAEIWHPAGICADASGNVYIADQQNSRVRKVTPGGIISTFAGIGSGFYYGDGGPASAAGVFYPNAVCIDAYGNIYISDGANQRIRIVNTNDTIYTIAGNGVNGFSGDGGLATNAELYDPCGVCTDPSGNVYIADGYNDRVRALTTTPKGIAEINEKHHCAVYPNPSGGRFMIDTHTPINAIIYIYNLSGEEICSKSLDKKSSRTLIDLSDQPSGEYVYRIKQHNGDDPLEGKLVILH